MGLASFSTFRSASEASSEPELAPLWTSEDEAGNPSEGPEKVAKVANMRSIAAKAIATTRPVRRVGIVAVVDPMFPCAGPQALCPRFHCYE